MSFPTGENQPVGNQSFDHLPSPLQEDTEERDLSPQNLTQTIHRNSRLGYPNAGHYAVETLSHNRDGSLVSLLSREDPDGQSDTVSVSPEACCNGSSEPSSVSLLSPPPSTPLPQNESTTKPTITPAMIQSALESLQQIQNNKGTPLLSTSHSDDSSQKRICPETVANALSTWMNQEAQHEVHSSRSSCNTTPHVSTPPSTPLDVVSSDDQKLRTGIPISSASLFVALSALVVPSRQSSTVASEESSVVGSVPVSTPSEGISEWLKLGFKPEDVIQALSVLSLQSREETSDDPGVVKDSLSPIQVDKVVPKTVCTNGMDPCHSDNEGKTESRSVKQEGYSTERVSFDNTMSDEPPDFVFSPPDHNFQYETPPNSNYSDNDLINSYSPVDDVLYS